MICNIIDVASILKHASNIQQFHTNNIFYFTYPAAHPDVKPQILASVCKTPRPFLMYRWVLGCEPLAFFV